MIRRWETSAEEIAAALGGRREGRNWRCRCPLHGGFSLILKDGDAGRVLATCWGGCDRADARGAAPVRTTRWGQCRLPVAQCYATAPRQRHM
jgi:hypothetical protein